MSRLLLRGRILTKARAALLMRRQGNRNMHAINAGFVSDWPSQIREKGGHMSKDWPCKL